MAERTSGLYRLVTIPAVYEAFQNALGGRRARQMFRAECFADLAGKRILEVGCGPGTWYPQMHGCASYVGVDWNAAHVSTANNRYGGANAQFICGDVSAGLGLRQHGFDLVFAFGLLHHLDDRQAASLVKAAASMLAPGGRFVAIEPVYHDGQHWFAKWMKDRDSGQNIRRQAQYEALLQREFAVVNTTMHTGKLRIPYSHCVIEAGADSASVRKAA